MNFFRRLLVSGEAGKGFRFDGDVKTDNFGLSILASIFEMKWQFDLLNLTHLPRNLKRHQSHTRCMEYETDENSLIFHMLAIAQCSVF